MISIHRARDRFVSEHAGITTYHSFSAGAHYDAGNVAFGRVVGVDEHRVDPGAGFDWHAHRGVTIVSWVLDGALLHEGATEPRTVRPGELFVQRAGDGIRHRETNPSDEQHLRFVQTMLVGDGAAELLVVRASASLEAAHIFVARGVWQVGDEKLGAGDSVRADESVDVIGAGELLVVRRVGA